MGKAKKETFKTYKVRISENAFQNIKEITGYIAFVKLEPHNAIKVGDAIFDKINIIVKNPFVYKECEQLSSKNKIYRQAKCFDWFIIYKIMKNEITVLGIIHSARKPSKKKHLKTIN